MASWNKYSIVIFCAYILIKLTPEINADAKDACEFIPYEWEIVDDGWPKHDPTDLLSGRKTQFYYNEKVKNKIWIWKIKKQILNELKDSLNYYKISFKLWFKDEGLKDNVGKNSGVEVENGRYTDYITKKYADYNYRNKWMPCEYVLKYENLEDFSITMYIFNNKTQIAFKDFKIEYEKESQGELKHELPRLNNWNSYVDPPKFSNGSDIDFFFFTNNCNNNCELSSSKIWIPRSVENAKFEVTVQFEYYIIGSEATSIKINNGNEINKQENKWNVGEALVNNAEYQKIFIKIKTGKISYAEKEFVAIRNLAINIQYKNDKNKTKLWTVDCLNPQQCKWTGISEAFWSKPSNLVELDKLYFYPTSINNSLTITGKDSIRDYDICYNVAFRASNKKITTIEIYYRNFKEENSNLILTLNPKISNNGEFEEIRFCLRDLIVLQVEEYAITFIVKQPDFINGPNDFLLRVDDPEHLQTTWNFTESEQNFLHKMNSDTRISDEWFQLLPKNEEIFEIDEKSIKFSANSSSQIPASAILLSKKWIKNDNNFHKVKLPSYSIKYKDITEKQNYKITPQICDTLFNCYEVYKLKEEITNNTETITFDFLPLDYSSHIKIMFQVEYFTTSKSEVNLEFELILEHFGDPCSDPNICGKNAECISDPKNDIPNSNVCEEIDQCNIVPKPKPKGYKSGRLYCEQNQLECETFDKNLTRCVCNFDNVVNWDRNNSSCVPPVIKTINWEPENGFIEEYFNPTDINNSLSYEFKDINNELNDVCFTMTYKTKVKFELTMNYESTKGEYNLFKFPLNIESSKMRFCVRDFLYKYESNFTISFTVKGEKNCNCYDENNFTSNFQVNIEKIKNESFPLLSNTAYQEAPVPKWKSVSSKMVQQTTPPFSINLIDKAINDSKTVFIISEWIRSASKFDSDQNYFVVIFKKGKEFTNINYYILKYNSSTLIETNKKTPKNYATDKSTYLYRMSELNNIGNIFKIIIEITYKSDVNTDSEVELQLQDLTIGDPCNKIDFEPYKSSSFCKKNAKCIALEFNKHICNCSGEYAGIDCESVDHCTIKEQKAAKNPCKQFPSLPNVQNCENDADSFRCKCYGNYIWKVDVRRCVLKEKLIKTKFCASKNCEFLESNFLESDMKWNNNHLPDYKTNDDDQSYRPRNNNSQIIFNITSLSQDQDICLSLSYILSENAKIGLKINDINYMNLTTRRQYPVLYSDSYEIENEEFCVKSAFGKFSENFKIMLYPIVEDKDDFSMIFVKTNKLIYNEKYDIQESKELSFLTFWNSIDSLKLKSDLQWPIKRPSNKVAPVWNFQDSNIIKFKAPKTLFYREAALISHLLKKEVSGRGLKFQIMKKKLKDLDIYELKNFILRIILLNENMQEIHKSDVLIGDNELNSNALSNESITYEIPEQKSSFRIGILVNYKTTDIGNYEEVEVTLKNLHIGDPCINDASFDLQNCNGGECLRNKELNDYKCNCSTKSMIDKHLIGRNCEIPDACHYMVNTKQPNIGSLFCKDEVGCINTKNNDFGFECECKNKTYWQFDKSNHTNSKCVMEPKCWTQNPCNTTTQMCQEPQTVEGIPGCICNEDNHYFNSTETGKCVKFDPCSEEMRTIKGVNVKKPCTDPIATCRPLGEGEDDYICTCPKGFKNSKSNDNLIGKDSKCTNIYCSFPSLNDCAQTCEPKNDNGKNYTCTCSKAYVKQGNDCKLISSNNKCVNGTFEDENGSCACKKGYKLLEPSNVTQIGCEPYLSYENDICPTDKLIRTKDNKLACDCGTKYKLNDKNTCDLKPLCGKDGEGRKDCDGRNALCSIYTNQKGEIDYECECTADKQFDSSNTTTRKCVNKCQIQDRDITCLNMNAVCDPSQIHSDNESVTNFCVCNPGFIRKDKEVCKLADFALQLSIFIKNSFDGTSNNIPKDIIPNPNLIKSSGADVLKLIEDYKSMNEENRKLNEKAFINLKTQIIGKFLKEKISQIYNALTVNKYKDRIDYLILENWILKSDFYECNFTITSNNETTHKYFKNLNNLLSSKCRLLDGSQNLCFIETDKIYYSDNSNTLVLDKEKLKQEPTDFKPCDSFKNGKPCPEFSICNQDGDSNKYSCTCDTEYFTVSREEPIALEAGENRKYKKQNCVVRDKCNECPSENGHCIQPLPTFDGKRWKADPICLCKKDYYLTNDNKTKQCTAVCGDHKCAHGDCKPKGESYSCFCNEGWNGDFCDKEYKTSMGGWIAGIVILAVLVVVAAGVAMIFARRARNNNYGNNSGHQLDDYTGSSYRVGQSGPAVARGRDNQSFHRD